MKLRSFFSFLSGIVAVLLLVGAVGAFWLTTGSPAQVPAAVSVQVPQQAAERPTTAMFISRQASLVVSLLTNPQDLKSFWLNSSDSSHRQSLEADLEQLPQRLFAKAGLDYERDLKAWLGNEVSFAVTTPDVDRDAATGLQPGYLLALKVAKPQLAQDAIQAFWQRRAGKNLVTEQFAGVPLVYAKQTQNDNQVQPNLSSALVGSQYVLIANYPKVLRDALNNVQVAALNLESSFTYQQALEQFTGQKLGFVLVNFAQTPASQSQISELQTELLTSATADPTPARRYDGLVAALRSDPHGLLANLVLLSNQPDLRPASATKDVRTIAKFVPAGSRLAVVDADLPQTWTTWNQVFSRLEATYQPWQALQQRWGIQLPDALLDWVNADYAIAEVPGRTQSDWVFVARRSAETAEGVARLDQLAEAQGANLGSVMLDDQQIYAWTKLKTANIQSGTASLEAVVQGVHTTIGDYELFATSLEAMEQALAAHTGTAETDLQAAVAQLQTPNQGYLLLNAANFRQWLLSPVDFINFDLPQELFNSFRAAVLSSHGKDELGLRGDMFLHLDDA
jgi:hypothetical protein